MVSPSSQQWNAFNASFKIVWIRLSNNSRKVEILSHMMWPIWQVNIEIANNIKCGQCLIVAHFTYQSRRLRMDIVSGVSALNVYFDNIIWWLLILFFLRPLWMGHYCRFECMCVFQIRCPSQSEFSVKILLCTFWLNINVSSIFVFLCGYF